MKRIAAIAFLFILLAPAVTGLCEEGDGDVIASSHEEVEGYPFSLIIVGTRSAADIDIIKRNLADRPYVKLLVPTVVSQRHLEFAGSHTGDEATLIADVESLASDRYDMVTRQDRRRGLVITLRKITNP